jgi:hypothetical protein
MRTFAAKSTSGGADRARSPTGSLRIMHPRLGPLRVNCDVLTILDDDQQVVVITRRADSCWWYG